jgi:hypothetical protein
LVEQGLAEPVDPEWLRRHEERWKIVVVPSLERHMRENARRAAEIRDIPLT